MNRHVIQYMINFYDDRMPFIVNVLKYNEGKLVLLLNDEFPLYILNVLRAK